VTAPGQVSVMGRGMDWSPDNADHPARILIVDDERHNRQLLEVMLKPEGFLLQTAASGQEALAMVEQQPPDLILLDIMMPGMDGYQVAARIKGNLATKNIPVIMVTALDDRNARVRGLSAGAEDFLTKPVDRVELCVRVRNLLRLKAYGDYHDTYSRMLEAEVGSRTVDLIQSERLYRSTFDEAPIGIVHQGLDGVWLRFNQRLCDLLGYSHEELQSPPIQALVQAGAADGEAEALGQLAAGTLDRHVAEERRFRRRDGTLVWTRVKTSIHRDAEGRPQHFISVIQDISEQRTLDAQVRQEILERHRAESNLRQERDRAQHYLDTAEVILLALDMDGRITLINRKGCDLLGWSERELLGRDWIDTCVPDRIRVDCKAKFRDLMGGGLPVGEDPILSRSGEERLIEWRNTVMRDAAGHLVGTLSSGTDITERTHATEALRAGEERMRFALQSADVGIWDMDCATEVVQWSEILESQYGVQPGTFRGTFEAFVERIHPDDRESVLEIIGKAMKSGLDFSTLNRAIWPDGSVRWLSGAGRFSLGEHGEPVRGTGISQDITTRRTLEAQFQQAQKMDAIGRLAGGVAHDFNNLLTVILGFCELLQSDLDPDDLGQADVAEIQKAGTRAAGLTRQLLAFSRKQILQPTRLDLNEIVADMRTMLGRLIREDVRVVVSLGPTLAAVKADRGQVEQVVMNLAVNAQDAMPRGGTLTIETANVELDEHYAKTHFATKPGPYVVLTVSDSGTGMTPEVQGRLFEPFFTTKEVGKGTGLGLATVHGIVTGNGGSVGVYSEVGRGSSFKAYFPMADEAATVVEAPPPSARPPVGTKTVLLVEDADEVRGLAKRLLERQGYTVLAAANADDARQLFERNASIDVLLTDVVMPGASGPELTGQLARIRPGLKVIYMSGYTEDAMVHHGVLDPGIAFLHKPFTAAALGGKIREVLER
jgi:two-component system cell cycle sensor histidine kinase/response regulator CckA